MKCTSILALASTTMAAALPQAGTTTPLRFGGLALRSASPIHLSPIAANGLEFFIGKNTTTYCPEGTIDCSGVNTNSTIFTYFNGQGTLGLDTIVPGGQRVYVTAGNETAGQLAGQLKFTQAHSSQTDGPALFEGFTTVYDGIFEFEGQSWLACEVDAFNSGYGIWAASRVAGTSCLPFQWKVAQVGDETASAWQYV